MPRAEAGTTKAISNKLKSKGLGRLRWYCQPCQRQMRDENGFKCHVQSESHVRQVLLIGEDPKKHIDDFSKQFLHNFINLLKTTHGEKKVHINQFYQQVITDKEHIHMHSTIWSSLTQFAIYLSREGICRMEETDKGLFVSWIDNSPETLRRREAVLKKERQDKGDEDREQRQIQEQIERAQRTGESQEDITPEAKLLQRKEGDKLRLNFNSTAVTAEKGPNDLKESSRESSSDVDASKDDTPAEAPPVPAPVTQEAPKRGLQISMSSGDKKPKNVFSAMRNPLGGKKTAITEPPKKMTEQERIMKAEMEAMERKRSESRSAGRVPAPKRQRVS